MLAKLLKYDFRALNRVMLPLQAGVLLATIVGSIVMRLAISGINNGVNNFISSNSANLPIEPILSFFAITMVILVFTAVAASSYVTLFLIARHFYQSFFQDDGYLTFTLPVTTAKSLLSKTIAGFVWMLINACILVLAVLLISLVGFASEGLINADAVNVYGEIFSYVSNVPGFILVFEVTVFALLALVQGLLHVYVSLTIGSVVAKTHKVLAGIGIYIAINIVVSTIVSIVSAIFGIASFDSLSMNSQYAMLYYAQPYILPTLLIYAALVVGFFLFSRHLLATKLNLD